MQKTLVIGDIHGCHFELQALLDKAGLGDGDAIISIGDLVDRGPESPQVAAFFQTTPNTQAVMGNHERKHVRAARHEVQLSISQRISQQQFGQIYQDALLWMSGLPLYIELDEAIIFHGYYEPGIALDQQNPSVLCGTMGGEKILRERYTSSWFELYDAEKPAIVGHYNYTHSDQPFVYRDRVFGLDTDCVTGKALTGILLPSFQIISVPSRGNLWGEVRRTYRPPQKKLPTPRPAIPWSEKQDRELNDLFHDLRKANDILAVRLRAYPGYADLPARHQARLVVEMVGMGKVANLLQLVRLGKLNVELLRKIVRDPQQLDRLKRQVAGLADAFKDRPESSDI